MKERMSKLFGEDKFQTHWQWYKKFFGEAIFKFFVSFISLLPIIAKVFQGNPNIVIETTLKPLFSWGLLWFAAVSYLISYLLYSIFCPGFIKTYNNYKEYKEYQHSPRWLVWLFQSCIKDKSQIQKLIERLDEKKYLVKTPNSPNPTGANQNSIPIVGEKQTVLTFYWNSNKYELGMPRLDNAGNFDKSATEVAEQEIFWEIFGRFSSTNKIALFTVSLFFSISVLLFSIVVIEYIISMTKFVF